MDDVSKALVQFIREEIGEFKMEIKPSSRIEDDLGVTGDEGIELIQSISKKFNVDISEFDFKKYFHPEPNFFTKYGEISPLTIQDIESAISIGKLI